jgi:hypothetical protein
LLTGPASVEAKKKRYLPLLSKTSDDAGEPVGDGKGFPLLERIDPDPLDVGLVVDGIGDPFRVRRPRGLERFDRAIEVVRPDFLRDSGRDVRPVESARVVREGDLAAVGGPRRPLVETRAGELENARLSLAVL